MFALHKLSIGHLADRLAHACGWSPVGKKIALHGAEGPFADLINGTVGMVSSLERGVIILDPTHSARPTAFKDRRLRLTPRHAGWTPLSLFLTRVAVVVEIVEPDNRPGPVAIAIAAVARERRQAIPE